MLKVNDFSDFLADAISEAADDGLTIGNPEADGCLHRCPTIDHPKKNNGAYIIHHNGDFYVLWYMSWDNGAENTICGKPESEWNAKEKQEYKRLLKDIKAKRQAELEKGYAESAKEAKLEWDNAKQASDDHLYLKLKHIPAIGLRQDTRGNLLVKIQGENGEIQSLQRLLPKKLASGTNKLYFSGGKVAGGYEYIPAKDGSKDGPLLIGEGYATCVSLHLATGYAVLIAFQANNLETIAKFARKKYPKRQICICADYDDPNKAYPEKGGTGVALARKAAEAIKAHLAICPPIEDGKADFNDLFCIENGSNLVSEAVNKALNSKPEIQNPTIKYRANDSNKNNFIYTENSLASLFEDKYKNTLRYDHNRKAWYIWNKNYWKLDETAKAYDLIRKLCSDVAKNVGAKERFYLEKASTASAVNKFVQCNTDMAVTNDIWDSNDFLLGTPGGVVDLKTGQLIPGKCEYYITRITSVTPTDNIDAPIWFKFLNEATNSDKELQHFMQQICGMCLTGCTREEIMIFIYGDGGNGKSIFIITLSNILGNYAIKSAIETFTASKNNRHRQELAVLNGARLVTVSETEKGNALAEARIKEFTGGEEISANFMRCNSFNFKPKAKLIMIGNHKPNLNSVDEAMRRRINIIPFTHKPKNVDTKLKEKLEVEYPSILRWMIDGCLDWQQNGLQRPTCVTEATQEYFDSQDIFGKWLDECCIQNIQFSCNSSDLFKSWKEFAEKNNLYAGNAKTFSGDMSKRGFEQPKKSHGTMKYFGIALKNNQENQNYERGCPND